MTTDVKDGVRQLTGILRAQNKMEEASAVEEQYSLSNEGKGGVEEITEQQQMKVVMVLSMLEEMGVVPGKSYDDVLRALVANNWEENQALGSFF